LLRLELRGDCFGPRANYLDFGRLHVEFGALLFAIRTAMLALSEIADWIVLKQF
jgi:hypothetical protein